MKVTDRIRRENFLAVEGRLLANGEQGQLTAEEWLYLYRQVKDDLVEAKAKIFAEFEVRIRGRRNRRAMKTVAL